VSYNPPEIPAEAQKIARKFFERAQTVADTRNYDYAIELFMQGLNKDPLAVEEGHKPLREAARRRKLTGGKKPGLLETIKRTTGQKKDPLAAMLSAEYFLAKDPFNVTYAEDLVKQADRAELPEALQWALDVYLELAQQEKKLNVNRLLEIKKLYEKLGDYYDQQDRPDLAIECYQKGLSGLETAIQSGQSRDLDLVGEQRDLAGKLTILRGKYERAGDFRDSIRDADSQKELQDQERGVKGEELLEVMIVKARKEVEENPDVGGKVTALVDLLLQRGKPEDEDEAIKVLETAYQSSGQYSFKMRADEVRIRQRRRKVSEARARAKSKPDDPLLQKQLEQADTELRNFELDVYRERVEHYPTDLRMKFEYGRRLYAAKRYDEAIPVFQEAVNDPRSAVRGRYYIGACFYQKGWYSQAVNVLRQAIEGYEIQGDQLSKEMHYILGRAQEDQGQIDQALETYGKLVQWDFNYRDVRNRIDRLQNPDSG